MKNGRTVLAAVAVVSVLVVPTFADEGEEEHFDVWLQAGASALITGAIDEDGTPLESVHRVFGAEFGEEPTEPFAADEPGFQAIDGTFGSSEEFRVNITDAVTRWTGSGFGSTGETITLEFGPSDVTSGAGFVSGFTFTADSAGGFHDHFEIILNGDGSGLGTDPDPGIYLLPLSLELTSGALAPTDTFWFVMNLGQDEADHDAAIGWVQSNLVPAPGAFALLAGFGLIGSRRRKNDSRGDRTE